MPKQINIYLKATALNGIGGRIDYISNPDRQEYLEAYTTTAGDDFWKELAAHCQKAAAEAGHKKACEGREFMFSLDNSLFHLVEPEDLAKGISGKIKKLTGTENAVALHWNKTGSNYHCHVVVAENREVNQVKEGAVLQKNTYYDASGKRSTKKNCIDSEGNLLPGCKFLKKGERKSEVVRFGTKIEEIGRREFLLQLKEEMANLQNDLLDVERFTVYKDDGLHITQQHVGKGKPEAMEKAIKEKNVLIKEYNMAVDKCLELSIEAGAEANLETQKFLKDARNDIKTYALTENWLTVISQHLESIRDKMRELRLLIQKVAQTVKKASLDDIIRGGRERVQKEETSLKTRNLDLER